MNGINTNISTQGGKLTDEVALSRIAMYEGQKLILMENKEMNKHEINQNQSNEYNKTIEAIIKMKPKPKANDKKSSAIVDTSMTECLHFLDLPKELQLYVLSFLMPMELAKTARVNFIWKEMVYDDVLWKEYFNNRYKIRYSLNSVDSWRRYFTKKYNSEMNMKYVFPQMMANVHISSTCLALLGDSVLLGGTDGIIREMETNTGKIKRLMKGQSESLTTLYSTKSLCVSGDSAGNVMLWDLSKQSCSLPWNRHSYEWIGKMKPHSDRISSASFDNDTNLLVTSSYDRLIKINDLNKAELIHTYEEHTDAVTCSQFDHSKVISCGRDGKVIIWDPRSNSNDSIKTQQATSSNEACNYLQYHDEIHQLCVATVNHIVIFDMRMWRMRNIIHQAGINTLQFDDRFIIGGTHAGVVLFYNFEAKQLGYQLDTQHLQYNDDVLVTAGANGFCTYGFSHPYKVATNVEKEEPLFLDETESNDESDESIETNLDNQ